MAERTLTIRQACEAAQVSRRTLYNWMDSGRVQFIRTAGYGRRVIASSLFRSGNVEPPKADAGA